MLLPLALVLGLHLVQLLLPAVLYWLRDRSPEQVAAALSPRDEALAITKVEGRAQRAARNLQEGLFLFLPMALLSLHLGRAEGLVVIGAWVFLAARIAYVPAYLLGWIPWRSVFWFLSLAGLAAMAVGLSR